MTLLRRLLFYGVRRRGVEAHIDNENEKDVGLPSGKLCWASYTFLPIRRRLDKEDLIDDGRA